MPNKNESGAFDLFRIIASALVMAIHSPQIPALGELGNMLLTGVFARIAVPFFFAATGFFTDFSNAESVKRSIAKTLILYTAAIAIFLPYGTYSASIRQLMFDGAYYHLWYFPAAAAGFCVVYMLKKLPVPAALTIASALYFFGLFGDSYYALSENISPLRKAFEALSTVFSYTRNGIFCAPIFMLIGNVIAEAKINMPRKTVVIILAPGLTLSLVSLAAERFFLRKSLYPMHDSMFLSLIPCTVFLILLLSSIKAKPRPGLRKISMWIYIIHPVFFELIARIYSEINSAVPESSNVAAAFASTVISLTIAALCGRVLKVIRHKNRESAAINPPSSSPQSQL